MSDRPGRLFIDYLRNRPRDDRGGRLLAARSAELPDRGACHLARRGAWDQAGCVHDRAAATAAIRTILCAEV
jgi:hypothetical protein